MNLGSLLDEAKRVTENQKVADFLGDLMDFEKTYNYAYKQEILDLLAKHRESSGR